MRRVFLALATVALFGCPGDSTTSPNSSSTYVGNYTLISVAGVALPAPSGTSGQTTTAGTLTISANGTFSYNETRTPSGSQTSTGTYTVSGLNITYTPTPVSGQDSQGATGVFSSSTYSTLTVTPSGEPVLVFTKQ
jgi:hypothetical protein